MTRYSNIVQKRNYDKVDTDGSGATEDNKRNKNNDISAPVERLKELKKSDFKIADHQPDIFGWEIIDTSGKSVGTAYDFLFDENDKKIRYLIVSLKKGGNLQEEKDILIPIGRARLDKDEQNIIVPNVSAEKLSALPVYRSIKSFAITDEKKTRLAFSTSEVTPEEETEHVHDGENFYQHEDFNEEKFYGPEK